ncbi:hypothetical protein CAEBREN_18136 [Caenorhabditis brenneri]|uniref:Uncharacterized protein n=1 Tax=Caenorhabditis brenneri TaxID=135651 RepID=G0MDG0_CAEBE|nr:hypothetical protein CAEBREN_18136 [Caenorhabditis brenneri]
MISRIPSIRITDRLIPLKINHLGFDSYGYTINRTSYSLGIIREIPGRNVPHEIRVANLNGGAKFDVNDFGEKAEFSKVRITPQDNEIEERRKTADLKKRKNYEMIEDSRPIYQLSFQLKISPPDRDAMIYNFPYAVPIDEAMKRINMLFFGHRNFLEIRNHEFLWWSRDDSTETKKLRFKDLVLSCKKLVVENAGFYILDWFLAPEVYIKKVLNEFPGRIYAYHVNEWRQKKPVGSCLRLGINNENNAVEALNTVAANMNGIRKRPRMVIVPINNTSQITVSYNATPQADAHHSSWILKFEFIAV